MSIRLVQQIFVGGALVPVDGAILSLPPALEADLVNQAKATWVVQPPGAADKGIGLSAKSALTAGRVTNLQDFDGGPIALRGSTKGGRLVFVGDSLAFGSSLRKSGYFDGINTWQSTVNGTDLTNGGWGAQYVWLGYVRPSAAGTGTGLLRTDGAGSLQWKESSGATYGPLVDVRQGGFFRLLDGDTPAKSCWVSIRGASAYPVSVNSTVAVTTGGTKSTQDYSLIGFNAWVAGALGDTFKDYQTFAMSGAVSDDVIKFLPQAIAMPADALVLLIGVNDTGTVAQMVANTKTIVTEALKNCALVYVVDIFPTTAISTAGQRDRSLVSMMLRDWTKTQPRARFVSAFDLMIDQTSYLSGSASVLRAGVHNDGLHLYPYGAYLAAKPIIDAINSDFSKDKPRNAYQDSWNVTERLGHWNTNPLLRGTGGTVVGSKGVIGNCPDGWTIDRSGATQTVTTAFTTVDGGLPFYSLSVAAATAGDYHKLTSTSNVAGGVAPGEYFKVTAEVYVGAITGAGLAIWQITATANGALQSVKLFDLTRNLANFSATDLPILHLSSEPQALLAGVTTFDLEMRVGADVGATGIVGIRKFRIERCAGPIYP